MRKWKCYETNGDAGERDSETWVFVDMAIPRCSGFDANDGPCFELIYEPMTGFWTAQCFAEGDCSDATSVAEEFGMDILLRKSRAKKLAMAACEALAYGS